MALTDLRIARLKAGYESAERAAKALGIHRETLYAYERGEQPIPSDVLLRMSALYNTSTDSLLGQKQ